MNNKYKIYPGGFMIIYNNPLLDEYVKKIGDLTLGNIDKKKAKDVIKTLEKSLINGKTFYENAPDYIRKSMEEYEEDIEKGIFID